VKILSLVAHNIRNLRDVELKPPAKFNVFIGDNGQGKTNLLETIYLISALRSFRASKLGEMVSVGQPHGQAQALVEYHGLTRHYQVEIDDNRRKASIDGKLVRGVGKYFGEFNVVVFTPDDLYVPRSPPSDRRKFLDRAVFNRDASYLATVNDYEKILRSRNQVLRQLADEPPSKTAGLLAMLDVYDEQLATVGMRVIEARRSYVAELAPLVATSFAAITRTGLALAIAYDCELADAAGFLATLQESRTKDRVRQTTSVGPHRDDLRFTLDGHPAEQFASQGQLRAAVLAWKASEIQLITQTREQTPILLLDDVSSELDSQRNSFLFEYLCTMAGQCFITTTDDKHVLLHADRANFKVQSGQIFQV
jgi:DNA replication and repair protein RecF